MELIVGLVIALGLLAVAGRFLFRSGSNRTVQLPRIVDDSIGMYALRKATGRPLGDRRLPPPIPAGEGAAIARPFNAATAKRLGIPKASDLVPERQVAAAASTAPVAGAAGQAATRRRLGPMAMGMLAIVAIAVGLALGAGLAVLVPGNGALGGTGGPIPTASQHAAPTLSSATP